MVASSIRIVERAPTEALKHYLKQHDLSLPEGFWQDAMQHIAQGIMEIEVSQRIEASRYERNGLRRAYRNGYRASAWLVDNANIPLRIPKLRSGTYYPSFLDNAHAEIIIKHYMLHFYTNNIDFETVSELLNRLEIEATSAQIAWLEENLYDLINKYRQRPIAPKQIHLDVMPVDEDGRKRYLALAFDDEELLDHEITSEADDTFWQDFVRRIDGRSIHGVEYVAISRVRTVLRVQPVNSPHMAIAA